jgi:hypothetical protein
MTFFILSLVFALWMSVHDEPASAERRMLANAAILFFVLGILSSLVTTLF